MIFSIIVQGLLTPRVIDAVYGTRPGAEPSAIGSRRGGDG
jgi:hypothetical protein